MTDTPPQAPDSAHPSFGARFIQAWRAPLRARGIGAAVCGLLGAPAMLTVDPIGIYEPERRLDVLAKGALLGALAGAAAVGPLLRASDGARKPVWLPWMLALVVLWLSHSNLIALSFTYAVAPKIAFGALALSAACVLWLWLGRKLTLPAAAVIGLVPLLIPTAVHHARWLRGPFGDCAARAEQPGVSFFGTFPDHDHPDLRGCVMYDVIADEERGLVFGGYIRQRVGVGAAVLSMRDRKGGHLTRTERYWQGDDRWMLNVMSIEPRTRRLWTLLASYEARLDPYLETFRYGATDAGLTLEHLRETTLPLDPSHSTKAGDRILVLDYPRRYDDVTSSRIAAIDVDDPSKSEVAIVHKDGWMTEYMIVDEKTRSVFVTDIAGHLFELDLDTLEKRREQWVRISMLGGALDDQYLYIAAPYRRAVVVLDRENFELIAALPCGNAVREVEIDLVRERLYATSYGDGTVCAFDLEDEGAFMGKVRVGTPLRGLHVMNESGNVLAGGGCGLAEIDPNVAFGF